MNTARNTVKLADIPSVGLSDLLCADWKRHPYLPKDWLIAEIKTEIFILDQKKGLHLYIPKLIPKLYTEPQTNFGDIHRFRILHDFNTRHYFINNIST